MLEENAFFFFTTAIITVVMPALYVLTRLLNLNDFPSKPIIYCKDTQFLQSVLKFVPILAQPYVPVGLWGKNGNLQTICHATIGRMNAPVLKGERKVEKLPDGTSVTFDIFAPLSPNTKTNQCTLLICPGIANCSETNYIRGFVNYAQNRGYRCIVLNHLGTLPHLTLTSPRIFTYGGTEEFDAMYQFAFHTYSNNKFVTIGFSMGGNVVTKYLGEKERNAENIMCGISVGECYDIATLNNILASKIHNWNNLWKLYEFMILRVLKLILRRYYHILFSQRIVQEYQLDLRSIFEASSLKELDENYTRKIKGYSSVKEYYNSSSSYNFMNSITVPMLFINSNDDPLVPTEVFAHPKNFAETHDRSLFVLTKHGGHIGYFEGSAILPWRNVTWKDRVLLDYIDGILSILHS